MIKIPVTFFPYSFAGRHIGIDSVSTDFEFLVLQCEEILGCASYTVHTTG